MKGCHLIHGIRLEYIKTFLVINSLHSKSSRNHFQEIHHSTTPSTTGSIPVRIGTGDSGARDEDLTRSTIPMPTLARKPPIMSSIFPVDIPKNSMVGQQR